jgi:iron complex outermembrane recepter protein
MKTTTLATATALATIILAATMAAPARAQTASAEDDQGLGDIIVTAQKRETNLQSTPIAISVATAEDLKNRNIQSLADLTNAIPSLRVAPFFSRSSALTVGMRGIVALDSNQPARDNGIGIYIDGVYLGRSQGLGAALFDVERIEVLKGPQGTLFGRNSTGGAVSIVSRRPTGEFGLRQTFGVRNFGGYSAETRIDLPRWGTVSFKVDGVISKREGTVDNTLAGERDFNSFDRRGLRISALWEPSDAFSAIAAFDISYDATNPYYVQLLTKNPATPALAPLVQVQSTRTRVTDIGVPQQDSIGKTNGISLHLDWKATEALTLRSITAYRTVDQTQFDNGGGAHTGRFTPNARFSRYSLASLRQSQWSQELQLIGSLPRFDFVAGAYYFHEAGDDDAWSPNTMLWNATGTEATRLPSLVAGAQSPFPDRASNAKADSFALFGQATWNPAILSDALKLTVGARYTKDKKSGTLTKVNGVDTALTFNISSGRVDPMVTVALDPAPGIHLYGKWGTAYRAGGANSRSLTYRSFGPEEVQTFEAGLKTEFFDRRVRLNFAAYSTRYSNIQIDFNSVNSLSGVTRTTLETVNAPGRGLIKGLEIDASVAPVRGLRLSAAYAYTTSNLPQAANPFNNNVLQNVFVIYTPDHAVTGSIDYELPLGGATLRAHIDGNFANGYNTFSGETTLTDKSTVFNGRLSLGDIELGRGGKLQVALWSRNLFNNQYTFVESAAANAVIGTYGIFNEPRTYGVDATISF